MNKLRIHLGLALVLSVFFYGCKLPNRLSLLDSISKSSNSIASVADAEENQTDKVSSDSDPFESINAEPNRVVAASYDEIESEPLQFEEAETKENSASPSNLNSEEITVDDVISSVAECYPEISIALNNIEIADAKILQAWGSFDDVFAAHSISQPLGFYQTYRNGAGVTRPLFDGGEIYGTYRIGDGNFEPWYGERETNEGGEFKAGFSVPLLKNRSIDKRRAKLWESQARHGLAVANTQTRMLVIEQASRQSYWDWVASGRAVEIQQRLLKLARDRVSQIQKRVDAGDLPEIAKIDNDRFIAKRANSLIKANRSLEKAAIKLSLFLRDECCEPFVAPQGLLPLAFPHSQRIQQEQFVDDLNGAFAIRPELAELNAKRKEVCVQLRYAENLTLPKLDFNGFAGQDVGGAASPLGDKTPFELQLGVLAEVPIQRRDGRGKISEARTKLQQLDTKIAFQTDKIRAEIQDAKSAVNAAYEQILQSTRNLELNRKSLRLGKIAFDEGDIDLIALNIYETSVADAELQLLDAQFKYFFYRAVYQTALGQSRLQ